MGLKKIRFLTSAIVFAGLLGFATTGYAAEEPSVEQVFVNLPEVTVFAEGIDSNGLEAFLGDRKLQTAGMAEFAATDQPIYYYVLLDVSNSIPKTYFEGVKQSIQKFENTLGANDRMILYTFGEQVNLILDEDHNRAETQAALAGIDNADNKTLLFEAVNQAAGHAQQIPPEICKRKIVMVISDGEDFTIGGAGAQDAKEYLKKNVIQSFAFAIADTARANINSFGEFARISGGRLTVFDAAQASEVLDRFHYERIACDVLELRADTNIATNRLETFTLKTGANRSITRDVMVDRHIPDTDAPVIWDSELTEDNKLRISFSEAVQGADVAANYVVKCEDKQISVTGISASQDDSNAMLLTFGEELRPGTYQVSCVTITDLSMEKNPVANTAEFEVEQPPAGTRILNAVKEWYWVFLVAAGAVLAAVIWAVYCKVKKGNGVVYVDGKPVMASGVELHKHIAIQEAEGKEFQVRVSVKGNKPEEMTLYMNGSFIVGRSKICNLYFDDKRMSRQHFVLEWDGQDMYVTDLDTTNGTLLNGVRITKQRRLNQGDKISAGSVEMTIRW